MDDEYWQDYIYKAQPVKVQADSFEPKSTLSTKERKLKEL